MTILNVDKMWSRQSGQVTTDDGKIYKIAFNEGWQVEHTYDATEVDICSAVGIPKLGDLYGDTYAWCKSVGPSVKLGPCFSIVPIQFAGEASYPNLNDSPLNQVPKIEWKSKKSTEPVDKDWYGRPITTVNNEPVDGVPMDIVDQTLFIDRNFSFFSPHLIHPYLHSVSSDQFPVGMYDPGIAKLQDYGATQETLGGNFSFWRVRAVIDFRYPYNTTSERAWYHRRRHEGFYERRGSLLTFSGGGGTGAGGHAIVNSSGVITAVVVITGGKGYTSAPSVAAADGTGATFTATIDEGSVTGVAVTAGGTGYKTRLVRAVDDNKEPTTKPILLKLDGSRELNPNNAAWIETKLYGSLPYSALGLL